MHATDNSILPFTSPYVRPFETGDEYHIHQIIVDNLQHVNSIFYSDRFIKKTINSLSVETILNFSQEEQRIMLVATFNTELVGTVSLCGSDIRMMFVNRHYHKNGIGKALIQKIEEKAREIGVIKLKLCSTINAEVFYQHVGFKKTGETTVDEERFILMSKALLPQEDPSY